MDLKALSTKQKSEEGVWLNILDMAGDPMVDENGKNPARLKVVGTNSKQFKAQQKMMMDASAKKKNGLSASEKLEWSMKIYSTAIVDWENIEWEGKVLPFTLANVKMVLEEAEPVLKQVVAFVDDSSNFLAN